MQEKGISLDYQVAENLQGKSFFDEHLPTALKKAQEYSGEKGFVASMPQLLQYRVSIPFYLKVWNDWFTAFTEEDVGRTVQGNAVAVIVHGGGILSSPERIEQIYKEGGKRIHATRFLDGEIKNLLVGRLPEGKDIQVYSFDDLKKGINDLPMRYAIVMDLDIARKTEPGDLEIHQLYDNPLFIARTGGVEQAAAYLRKAEDIYASRPKLKHGHRFDIADPDQPVGYFVMLGGGNTNAFQCNSPQGPARFVAVNQEAIEAYKKLVSDKLLENKVLSAVKSSEAFDFKTTHFAPVKD